MNKNKKINWGIIGLGNIAHQFATDLQLVEDAKLYAVASRSYEKASAFTNKYNATKAYDSYLELITDSNIDIVYIATPHNLHAELSIKALEHGKHVLCEKPVALNLTEAALMIKASRENSRFFMEAFWTRFNPSFRDVLFKVKQGLLGEIKYINADFAFNIGNPSGRMADFTMGGGSLLDMGVYPLFLAYMILGNPIKVLASANFFDTGADKQTSMILHYNEAQAVLHSSFVSSSNMIATISGTEGRINLHPMWNETQGYSLIQNNKQVDYQFPTNGKGFTYEIEECHRCINNNQLESKLWSHQNCLDLIKIVDDVRSKTGLKYPSEI